MSNPLSISLEKKNQKTTTCLGQECYRVLVCWSSCTWCLSQRLVSVLFGVSAAEDASQSQNSNIQMKSEELHQVCWSRVDWCVYFLGSNFDNRSRAKLTNQIVLFTPALQKEMGLITNRVVSQTNQACCLSFCVSFLKCNTKQTSSLFKMRAWRLGQLEWIFLYSTRHNRCVTRCTYAQSSDSGKQWCAVYRDSDLIKNRFAPPPSIWLEQSVNMTQF